MPSRARSRGRGRPVDLRTALRPRTSMRAATSSRTGRDLWGCRPHRLTARGSRRRRVRPERAGMCGQRRPGEIARAAKVRRIDTPFPVREEIARDGLACGVEQRGMGGDRRQPCRRQRFFHAERGQRIDEGAGVADQEELRDRRTAPSSTRTHRMPSRAAAWRHRDVDAVRRSSRWRRDTVLPARTFPPKPRADHHTNVPNGRGDGHRPGPSVLERLDDRVRVVGKVPRVALPHADQRVRAMTWLHASESARDDSGAARTVEHEPGLDSRRTGPRGRSPPLRVVPQTRRAGLSRGSAHARRQTQRCRAAPDRNPAETPDSQVRGQMSPADLPRRATCPAEAARGRGRRKVSMRGSADAHHTVLPRPRRKPPRSTASSRPISASSLCVLGGIDSASPRARGDGWSRMATE